MCNQSECGGYCHRMHRRANRGAEWFATIGIGVLVLAHFAGFIEGVFITLACIGALVAGITAGYVYIRWVLPARRAARMYAIPRGPGRAPIMRDQRGQLEPRHQAPDELPGGQHVHIHLPPGSTPADVSRWLGGGR